MTEKAICTAIMAHRWELVMDLADRLRAKNEVDWGECADHVIAAYWYATDYHAGQWSTLYAVLCSLDRLYKPSPLVCGADDEGDWAAELYYQLTEDLEPK